MEPLSAALVYATITGLMADFTSSRARAESLEIAEFVAWLRTHGHNHIVELIERNEATIIGVKAALAEGTDRILAHLNEVASLVAALSPERSGVREMAVQMVPKRALSIQCQEILCAFETLVAGKALLHHTLEGASLFFLDGKHNGTYQPRDERFFETDLSELCTSGLVELSHNGRGQKVFQITRRGAAIGKMLLERQVN